MTETSCGGECRFVQQPNPFCCNRSTTNLFMISFLSRTIDFFFFFLSLCIYLWLAETSQQPISQTTWLEVTPHCIHFRFVLDRHNTFCCVSSFEPQDVTNSMHVIICAMDDSYIICNLATSVICLFVFPCSYVILRACSFTNMFLRKSLTSVLSQVKTLG